MGTSLHSWLWLTAACGGDPRHSDPTASWKLLDHDEPAALLSIWGADTNDVWAVGGRADLAGGPTVLHYDGSWARIDTGQQDLDLWSMVGVSSDDIFFGGSGGTILRRRNGVFERMTTPRTGTIFGLWAASATDVWAVGDGGAGGAIAWHFDGTQWSEPPLPSGVPSRVFKVHAQTSNDVWMSCVDGSVLHWQGLAIERQATGVSVPLFALVTTPDDVVAVGGGDNLDTIVEHATDWAVASMGVPTIWRGAAVQATTVYALGQLGVLARRDAGSWSIIDQPLIQQNFHGGWIDPDGGLWTVGGDFDHAPLTSSGFIEYLGTASIEEVP
jgi:hypothetical protein